MSTHDAGRRYEALAGAFLELHGWTVLQTNVRFRRKEVDLIVRRGRTVAFVEVKGRRTGRFGDPLESITWSKRREIETVARWWIERSARPDDRFEFHAVAVYDDTASECRIRHVPSAWTVR